MPEITKIQGSNPSGPTDTPEADPRMGGQQSLHIVGTDMGHVENIFMTGPGGGHICKFFKTSDTEGDIVGYIPLAGRYAALAVTKKGEVSSWYYFSVI